jgi:hypothetical protein
MVLKSRQELEYDMQCLSHSSLLRLRSAASPSRARDSEHASSGPCTAYTEPSFHSPKVSVVFIFFWNPDRGCNGGEVRCEKLNLVNLSSGFTGWLYSTTRSTFNADCEVYNTVAKTDTFEAAGEPIRWPCYWY